MLCKKCRDEMTEPFFGYYPFMEKNAVCNTHNGITMTETPITCDEYLEIINIAPRDISFLEAMIDLKQKDPIEFQLKMSQFKAAQSQVKAVEENSSNCNLPKCPTCNSTDLSKISTAKKVAKIAAFGIFGMGDNGKTWKCNNCGSKF